MHKSATLILLLLFDYNYNKFTRRYLVCFNRNPSKVVVGLK